jgi:hypothetical protein
MVKSSVGKGIESLRKTAAGKTKAKKSKAESNGSGMNGPHRPKLLGANVEVEFHKAFRQMAIDQETTIQKLVCEGLNLVAEKYGSKVRTAIE